MRITFTVKQDKADGLLNKAKKMEGVKTGIKAASVHLVTKLREYPPQPSGVKYKRTGDLKRFWTHKISNQGFTSQIGNKIPYVTDVQIEPKLRYFKRVWGKHSVKYVATKQYQRILDIVRNEIRKAMR